MSSTESDQPIELPLKIPLLPTGDPFSRLLRIHITACEMLDAAHEELSTGKDRNVWLNKSYSETINQNETLISLIEGNVASPPSVCPPFFLFNFALAYKKTAAG